MNTDALLLKLGQLEEEPRDPDTDCPGLDVIRNFREARLSASERESLEAHLAECPPCLDELSLMETPVPRLSNATVRQIVAETAPTNRVALFGAWYRWAGALMTGGALLIIGIRVLIPAPEPISAEYQLGLTGFVASTRGIEAQPPKMRVYEPDSDLVFRVFPRQGQVEITPSVTVYLQSSSGSYVPLSIAPSLSQDPVSGMITLRIRAEAALGDRFGSHRVRVVLLPESILAPPTLTAGEDTVPYGQVLEARLEYRPAMTDL